MARVGKATASQLAPPFRVNQANVLCRDVTVSNGILHVIDSVLIPPTLRTAWTVMTAAEDPAPYARFAALLSRSGLSASLDASPTTRRQVAAASSARAFTLFVPESRALDSFDEWQRSLNQEPLSAVALSVLCEFLAYHIVVDKILLPYAPTTTAFLSAGSQVIAGLSVAQLVQGDLNTSYAMDTGRNSTGGRWYLAPYSSVYVAASANEFGTVQYRVNRAAFLPTPPLLSQNSAIHLIDGVLIPPRLRSVWFALFSNPAWFEYSAACLKYGLDRELGNLAANFTVIAPDNPTFKMVIQPRITDGLVTQGWSVANVVQVLKSFWVTGAPCASQVGCSFEQLSAADARLEMTSGVRMIVRTQATMAGPALTVGGLKVSPPYNELSRNGVVHTLSADLVSSPPIDALRSRASPRRWQDTRLGIVLMVLISRSLLQVGC